MLTAEQTTDNCSDTIIMSTATAAASAVTTMMFNMLMMIMMLRFSQMNPNVYVFPSKSWFPASVTSDQQHR